MKDTLPNFAGKIVSLSTGSENALELESPVFRKMGRRMFVVGQVPSGATTDNWAAGLPCAIAWEAVTDYLVFDTPKQFQKLMLPSKTGKEKRSTTGGTVRR